MIAAVPVGRKENQLNDNCPICLRGKMTARFCAEPLDYSGSASFPIYACAECGYGKTDGIASDTDGLYEGGCYDLGEKAWHRILAPLLRLLERFKLRHLHDDSLQGKRLLEIGCGKGRFLEMALNHGIKGYGIEPSARSFAFASSRLGSAVAPVALESIDSMSSFPAEFDYVVLWHVLEHLDEPERVLSQINNRLSPNGKIVIAVPNLSSIQARLGKSDWYHLDPSRHIHHFTPVSLKLLATRNGYRVTKMDFGSFYQNFVGDIVTIENMLLPGKNVVFNGLRLNSMYFRRFGRPASWTMFALGLLMGLILAPFVIILTLASQLLGRSGTMVAIIQPQRSAD